MLKRITLAIALLLAPVAALAQSGGSTTRPTWFDGATQYYISTAHPLPVTASVSASISGFPTTQTTGTPISVTTGGVAGSLPSGAVVVATNVGTTNAAYCKLGASASTSDQYIAPSGGWFAFTVGAASQLTCITSTSTTTVNMVGGSGLPTGTGGGSGGGGGGGAVTIADGADVTQGALADAAASAGGTGTLSAKLRLMTTQLGTINSTLGSPFQAGGSIGNTSFASTQSGTWNITNVSGTVSLPTGASTAAKQPALGTAGTASSDVLTVQGIASMTPLASNITQVLGAANSASNGLFVRTGTGQIASGSFASGSIASGAVSSGAYAAGALAAGAFATGAGVDGWDLTQGAIADAAVTAGATGSNSAKLRSISRDIGTVATNSALPLPVQIGIGNVNIGAVQSAGSAYETVAASVTGQALGATGATGDYLSHCVIYPATTGAGLVTVFDSTSSATNNVITFTSGTLSNLAPIAIPVGALSLNGAWKVTTGSNVTVTCYGKFT